MSGSGLSVATAGDRATFFVRTYDRFGNPMYYNSRNVKDAKISISGYPNLETRSNFMPDAGGQLCNIVSCSQYSRGIFRLQYILTIAGQYAAAVVIEQTELALRDLITVKPAATSASLSSVIVDSNNLQA